MPKTEAAVVSAPVAATATGTPIRSLTKAVKMLTKMPTNLINSHSRVASPMPQPALNNAGVDAQTPRGDDQLIQAPLALLRELESSLEASRKALLNRDLAGLEQATREQARLHRALENLPLATSLGRRPLSAELQAARKRVLHLGLVQWALLERAGRWLRTLERLASGPGASYGPPPLRQSTPHHDTQPHVTPRSVTAPRVEPFPAKPSPPLMERKEDRACRV